MATDWTQEHRLKRLMLFRVVMITTLLLIAIYVETVSETLLPVNPLYFLIAGTYGLTLVYALALRYLPYRDVQVYVQVIFDLLVITGLVYLTGGPGSRAGFILLYPISVLSGSVLLYRRKSVALAGVATLLYAAMLWGVRGGWVPAGQALSDVPAMAVKHVLYSIFVTGVACVTVSLIGSYLAQSLETVGLKLEEAAEEVADLRELQQVMVRSQALEIALNEFNPESRVLDGRTAQMAQELEDRIARVDRALEATELSPQQGHDQDLLSLWRERVGLLDALVDVHLTRASDAGL